MRRTLFILTLLILALGLCKEAKAGWGRGFIQVPGTCDMSSMGGTCSITIPAGTIPMQSFTVFQVETNVDHWDNQECVTFDGDCHFAASYLSGTVANGSTITLRSSCSTWDNDGQIPDTHCVGNAKGVNIFLILDAEGWFTWSASATTINVGGTFTYTATISQFGGNYANFQISQSNGSECSVQTDWGVTTVSKTGSCTAVLRSGSHYGDTGSGCCDHNGYRTVGGSMVSVDITLNVAGVYNFTAYDGNWRPLQGGANFMTINVVVPNQAPVTVSVSGLGANLYYGLWFQPTIICRDPDGVGNIVSCRVIIGYGVDDNYTCDLIYYPNSNQIGLLNDAHSDWQLRTPGAAGGSVGNTYCQLDATGSSASNSGTDTTWYPRIYFKPAVISAGKYLVGSWMLVMDSPGATAGWSQMTSVTTMVRPSPRLTIVNQH